MMSTLHFHYHHHGYGCLCNLPHSDPLKFGNADKANQQLVCAFISCLYSMFAYVSEFECVVEYVLGCILTLFIGYGDSHVRLSSGHLFLWLCAS